MLAALVIACGGSSNSSAPTATPSVEPTATAVDLGPPEAQQDRILEHIRMLSEQIGVRPAGSPAQDEAVDYARAQLESWGYEVEVQDFQAGGAAWTRYATLAVTSPEQRELPIVSFQNAAGGTFTGRLVDAGTGQQAGFSADVAGALVLVQRQDVPFVDMIARALDAGATGVVIANKEAGMFPAGLEEPVGIPVVIVSLADGEALRSLIARGAVEVRIDAPAQVTARNVIARPTSGVCRTISGGHYDSIPWAPGANDNGSGASLVLELARAAAAAHLTGSCFVLFGAEEGGLLGSKHLIAQLTPEQRAALEAVYNYDVLASDAPPTVIGGGALSDEMLARAAALGIEARADVLPMGTSSDQASFLDAGIPAVLITTPGFGNIHTVNDTFANISTAYLADIARLAFALLQPAPSGTPQARGPCPPLAAGVGSPSHPPHGGTLASPSMACPGAALPPRR